jgi:hypothetical protein
MKTNQLSLIAAALLIAASVASVRAAEVDTRQADEQARIKQGEQSGQLTKGEARSDERTHKAIGKEIKADRAANGGKLTPKEKAKINHQQNKESRKIHRTKTNNKVAK